MTTALTIVITLLLIVMAARVIHLLNAQHAERIVLHRYSRFHPGVRGTPSDATQRVPDRADPAGSAPTRRPDPPRPA
ncbi:hypothetical protein ABT071_37385 [Streptomyces sp. NPDC002506]|uniref:hypothetical protein n=1 Tax=Streptomyces sp. NPDC002506 TaxID=3154536 RepID=UPI00331CD83B